jgi:hypothetical protein
MLVSNPQRVFGIKDEWMYQAMVALSSLGEIGLERLTAKAIFRLMNEYDQL